MPNELSKEELDKRAQTIEAIYQEYQQKLDVLKVKQDKIIEQFQGDLERKKGKAGIFKRWYRKLILLFDKK